MQRVDPAHQSQIGSRSRAVQVLDAAPADPQNLRLPTEQQIVMTVDHRFALRSPAFPSAPDKNSLRGPSVHSPASAPRSSRAASSRRPPEQALRPSPSRRTRPQPIEKLTAPLRDLVRVHVKLLRQLDDRLLAPHGCKGHLRLEGRRVVTPRSFRHGLSCCGNHAAFRQKLHLSALSSFPEPALYRATIKHGREADHALQ
jgi:hypothetical protein